jgi:seryl-tRNA synthetase
MGRSKSSHALSSQSALTTFQRHLKLSSASNCTDYQSRRLSIRYRPSPTKKNAFEDLNIPTPAALEATALYPSNFGTSNAPRIAFAHTLNATAAAIPRLIIAILENGVVLDKEGQVLRVRLPVVLKKFWIGDLESETIEWVRTGDNLRID